MGLLCDFEKFGVKMFPLLNGVIADLLPKPFGELYVKTEIISTCSNTILYCKITTRICTALLWKSRHMLT